MTSLQRVFFPGTLQTQLAMQKPQNEELSIADIGLSNGETLVLRARDPIPEPAPKVTEEPNTSAADSSFIDLVCFR